jgi:hypothetical protein
MGQYIFIFPGFAVAATFNLKPGLWEMTWTEQTTGGPPVPEDVLARMTPGDLFHFKPSVRCR